MAEQLMQSACNESFEPTDVSSILRNPGLTIVNALHATLTKIAHNGPPLDMVTQLCAVVAHVDLEVAEFFAREGLRSIFRAAPSTSMARQMAQSMTRQLAQQQAA